MVHKKIALVGFHLSGGGAAKVMANLSNFFFNKGIDVHIIIFHNELGYNYSGKLFNLGKLKSKSNTVFNKAKRFYSFKQYIDQNRFDLIIDFRFRKNFIQEYLINRCIYNSKVIYTVHSSKLNVYMPNSRFLSRLLYGSSFKMVAVSKSMQDLMREKFKLNNITTIYNLIDPDEIQKKSLINIELGFKFIIAVGEYNKNEKQFHKLIEAYSKSELPDRKISLVILGKGGLKNYLLSVARKNNVEDYVHLLGFKSNPYKYLNRALFCVLSSKYEGLPMVLIESLACGTPVISFNCPTGPSEIVLDKINGLLVENQNFNELLNAMNLFATDEQLYSNCKEFASKSIDKFSIENVGEQWLDLINKN